jgi:hypothetical protein
VSSAAGPPGKKKVQCPVFGSTRKHALDDCQTFQDVTPKERLDLVHVKQLCLFCLGNPMGEGCKAMGKWPSCTVDGCGKPHGVLKAGESSLPAKGTDSPSEPTVMAAAGEAPDLMRQLRGLLKGLGLDPDALEVRIRVQRQWRPRDECNRNRGKGADW